MLIPAMQDLRNAHRCNTHCFDTEAMSFGALDAMREDGKERLQIRGGKPHLV
jgi:hypothetical protein